MQDGATPSYTNEKKTQPHTPCSNKNLKIKIIRFKITPTNVSTSRLPPQTYPPQGYPQNLSTSRLPPQTYPPQGYPPQPYPPQGYPPQPPTGMIQQQQSNNTTVVVQNQPQHSAIMVPVVNDHLGLSIFSCLFCPIWPIGLVAIIKSLEVRNLYVTGNHAGAIASAKCARKLAGISIGIGIVLYVVFTIMGVVMDN
ncbi:uncharacterized protein LOC124450249 [Xenia sp. Carnegie-2017]|uniref:uncharacterized protein LOC124450249 n=1 Tax=Xenia sp. Carnegie-2017 TaxID=2897299 RepID=UPI001F034C97|nr:uncharacterized protein LOC124450249 [Xenia sp. Carnegie-2017]